MKCRILLAAGLLVLNTYGTFAIEKGSVELTTLVKVFEQNPSDSETTMKLLKELERQGKSCQEVLNRYFQTQKEEDYFKDYNWVILRDYVTDIHSPQMQFLFKNQDRFIQYFSKDDVFQKMDNVLVDHLEEFYENNKTDYEAKMRRIKEVGYEHYDVVYDYFNIRQLRADRNADDYFYKARKLFRYFPENKEMIKEITEGALEIMSDVSRLKVIQLWAGKTVESQADFEAICNYVKISQKCGFNDVAKKYAEIANKLAVKSGRESMKSQASELMKLVRSSQS